MFLVQEPRISFKKVEIHISKTNDELSEFGIIPGMVLQVYEEFEDGISTQRFWVNEFLFVSPPYCRVINQS